MPAEPRFADALRCPREHGRLDADEGALRCRACGARYPLVAGIPDFVGAARASTPRWRAAQRFELAWWRRRGAGAAHAPGERERFARAARALAERFDALVGAGWRTRVVHVGPAGRGVIHELDARERWAVEPLALELDREGLLAREGLHWVAALGEELPFPDACFTAALAPNLLDHVADPARLLAELRRCLAPRAPLWLSCHVTHAPLRPLFSAAAALRIGHFAGHPRAFTAAQLRALLDHAGFRVVDEQAGAAGEETGARGALKRRLLATRYFLALA